MPTSLRSLSVRSRQVASIRGGSVLPLCLGALLSGALTGACATDKTTDKATGGAAGTAGMGATAGNGGAAGSAGSAGNGGTAGTAGNAGAAGSAGVSGSAGSGGPAGNAGTAGNAGIGGVGPDATIQDGAEDRILLTGMIVTPLQAFQGQVLVEGEDITCVEMGTGCESAAGASGATRVDTNGIILPGLIDTHNHILFDVFDEDDWVPTLPSSCGSAADCISGSSYCSAARCDCVDSVCRYKNHNDWPRESEYGLMLDYKQCLEDASQGKPVWCPLKFDGSAGKLNCEMNKWGELKGLIAGTTSIVGLPGTGYPCYASLSRSIDLSQNDLGQDKIQTSALFPPSSPNGVCVNFSDGDTEAYLIHVGEGVDTAARNEWGQLNTITTPDGCLLSHQTAVTHGTAFTKTEFDAMAAAKMKLTWSPASNVALYGTTTDIPTALNSGVVVALGPDWSMGGSQNLLDELRFADHWDNTRWGDNISPEELVRMVTTEAAKVVALEATIGKLEVGFKADIMVIGGDVTRPFESIVSSSAQDVRLVMVGGRVLFGDAQLEAAGPTDPGCEPFSACGHPKFLCVAEASSSDRLNQTAAQIEQALNDAFTDIDNVPALPASACGSCSAAESCYARTSVAPAQASDCPTACAANEACFRAAASGANQFRCLSVNACAPTKNHSFFPVAPALKCP